MDQSQEEDLVFVSMMRNNQVHCLQGMVPRTELPKNPQEFIQAVIRMWDEMFWEENQWTRLQAWEILQEEWAPCIPDQKPEITDNPKKQIATSEETEDAVLCLADAEAWCYLSTIEEWFKNHKPTDLYQAELDKPPREPNLTEWIYSAQSTLTSGKDEEWEWTDLEDLM